MISRYKDELVCDLAETYHIYDYRSFPISYIATLAQGLRDDSRIKIAFSSFEVSFDTLLMASLVDTVKFIAWTKTEDAYNGGNKPESLVAMLCGLDTSKDKDIMSFSSPEEFERARAQLIGE